MALFKNGTFSPDPWLRLDAGAGVPEEGKFLLSAEQWRDIAASPLRPGVAYGLMLEPGTDVDSFRADYPRLALVAINFPKFVDGRGYSMGRKIREEFGFAGELRATGDVLFDQLQLLARCGFDAFEISNKATLDLLAQGRHSGVMHFYQPGYGYETPAGTRPWARRPASQ